MALMVTYVETMVLPAFSNFESFFHVTEASTIAWILSAYLLVGVVVTPIFGKLGDIYGKKRMLLIAMVRLRRRSEPGGLHTQHRRRASASAAPTRSTV